MKIKHFQKLFNSIHLIKILFLKWLLILNLFQFGYSWTVIEAPLKHFDLNKNSDSIQKSFLYEFTSKNKDSLEQFRFLKEDSDYLVLGARFHLF
jgi:hypothetical protein